MHPKFLHETAKNISIPLAIFFKYIHGNDEIASILEGSKCNTASQKRTKKLSREIIDQLV
jgi:hypothetical protein